MSQILMHIKGKERHVPQLIQKERNDKKRQADILKKQQEKDKAKVQAAANKDKPNKTYRPRSHRSKGKAYHPDQIKSYNKGRKTAR